MGIYQNGTRLCFHSFFKFFLSFSFIRRRYFHVRPNSSVLVFKYSPSICQWSQFRDQIGSAAVQGMQSDKSFILSGMFSSIRFPSCF